jgi:hypothetical protein
MRASASERAASNGLRGRGTQWKDGEVMHTHDEEAVSRQKLVERPPEHDAVAAQAAAQVAASGQLRGHEPKAAVLRLQRLAGNSSVGSLVGHDDDNAEAAEERSPVLDVVGKGGGSPLPTDLRMDMEAHLGADFSSVRVHDGAQAAESAKAVQARAYTVGDDLVFNTGAYSPGTDEGRRTLAHELTHVVQQRAGPVDATPAAGGIAVSDPSDRFELEAEAAATALPGSAGLAAGETAVAAPVQREAAPEEEEEEVQMMALQREEAPEEEEEEMPA